MRSRGMKMLDEICYLSQIGAITKEERIEYADIITLAMHNDRFFSVLKRKLLEKANESGSELFSKAFFDAVETLDT